MKGTDIVISGFTVEQTSRLTGVSVNQLASWDRNGFYTPELAHEDRKVPFARLYSFRDLLNLQILDTLRNESKVPMPHLREVRENLNALGDDSWTGTTLYVLNRRVIFDHPDTGDREEVVTGQGVLGIPLKVVRANMKRKIEDARERKSGDIGAVEQRRNVVRNRPVFAGTRIPVDVVRAFIDAGASDSEILAEYPRLTIKDIGTVRAGDADAA